MKTSLLALLFVAASSFGSVTVVSASYNYINHTIIAQLQYGGCGTPAFALNFDRGCYETTIPQAEAKVVQTGGNDGCERLNQGMVSFALNGDPCASYGRHFVNLHGTNAESNEVRVSVDPTLE